MVENNAGGFVFKLDEWKQLERFLILGTEGGTFYVSEKKLTAVNANQVLLLLKKDGVKVVEKTVEMLKSEGPQARHRDLRPRARCLPGRRRDQKGRPRCGSLRP